MRDQLRPPVTLFGDLFYAISFPEQIQWTNVSYVIGDQLRPTKQLDKLISKRMKLDKSFIYLIGDQLSPRSLQKCNI